MCDEINSNFENLISSSHMIADGFQIFLLLLFFGKSNNEVSAYRKSPMTPKLVPKAACDSENCSKSYL
jgi:hypothetical protein